MEAHSKLVPIGPGTFVTQEMKAVIASGQKFVVMGEGDRVITRVIDRGEMTDVAVVNYGHFRAAPAAKVPGL